MGSQAGVIYVPWEVDVTTNILPKKEYPSLNFRKVDEFLYSNFLFFV